MDVRANFRISGCGRSRLFFGCGGSFSEEQRKETRADRSARAERRRHKIPRWRPRGEKKCWSTASRRPRAGRRPPPACPSDEGTPPPSPPLPREIFSAERKNVRRRPPIRAPSWASPDLLPLLLLSSFGEEVPGVCGASFFPLQHTRKIFLQPRFGAPTWLHGPTRERSMRQ